MPKGPALVKEGQLYNTKSKVGDCLGLNGNTILVQKCKTDGSDIWQEFENGEFVHKKSGKCMSTFKKNNGTPITLADCTGDNIQKWKEVPTKNGKFMIESSLYNNQCVDLPGGAGNVGLKTQMWDCRSNDGDNFQYKWI